MTVEQRMDTYALRADRADVIVPAAEIFLMAAEALGCEEIEVPNISLADSIVDGLYNDKYAAATSSQPE
jgi:exopolyphosphatase/guanosine-5'-triphosphate,3'-diphosphate pyrophosphatase